MLIYFIICQPNDNWLMIFQVKYRNWLFRYKNISNTLLAYTTFFFDNHKLLESIKPNRGDILRVHKHLLQYMLRRSPAHFARATTTKLYLYAQQLSPNIKMDWNLKIVDDTICEEVFYMYYADCILCLRLLDGNIVYKHGEYMSYSPIAALIGVQDSTIKNCVLSLSKSSSFLLLYFRRLL